MQKPNIVWFIIDSLRPKSLGNFFEPTFIDELIKEGTSFTQCIAAAPYTIASENAMFTSFYPSVNKLNGWFKNTPENLDKKIITFIDILKAEGYFTACFYPTRIRPYIPPYSFDIYELVRTTHEFPVDRYLSADSPKFLVLDFEGIHDVCCANLGTFTKQKYCEAVKHTAEEVKYFYDMCCGRGDVVIITSDHGIRVIDEPASIYHKDEFVTGKYLTDKTVKCFFSIIAPDKIPSGIEIKEMIRNIDIVPTVLDTVGLPILKGQGISLLPYIKGAKELPKLYAFSETGGMATSPWKPDVWSVRTPKWKFVLTKIKKSLFTNTYYKKELHDLTNDPYELENKAEEFPRVVEELFERVKGMLLSNSKDIKDYYRENDFDYKKYLRTRTYPFEIRLRVILLTLINYKLTYRLKIQLRFIAGKIKRLLVKWRGSQLKSHNKN